ncbi:MAG: TIM44-like domain-containing protein [Polyangiaceae bacterium]
MNLKRFRNLRFILGLVFVLSLGLSAFAARPGGGSSFRGGSSSSTSGSRSGSSSSSSSGFRSGSSTSSSSGGVYVGSGDSSPAGVIIGFFFVIVIVVVVAIIQKAARGSQRGWSAGAPNFNYPVSNFGAPPPPPQPSVSARKMLEGVQRFDENFSLVVFDDFLTGLYTEVIKAQGEGRLQQMTAYLGPNAFGVMQQRPLQGISTILVGSCTIDQVHGVNDNSPEVHVHVLLETNMSRRDPQTGYEQAIYTNERWVLARGKNAKSRTPDKARVFACPNCTAPLDKIFGGKCTHCGQNVASGAFDWIVREVTVLNTENRGPMLTGTTEEQGTDFPTIVDPGAQQAMAALNARDPQFEWNNFLGRVTLTFSTFQKAWSERSIEGMRPFMSDAIFATQSYWVDEYKRQRLRNITENARILKVELARASTDAFFDAITVRLYASSFDFTVSDDTNQIVAGNRQRERMYSEYWTFIRGRNAKGPAKTEPNCPRCGAPLNVNMGGSCQYCQAKVTSGDFDWVLSRIEQDEVYAG